MDTLSPIDPPVHSSSRARAAGGKAAKIAKIRELYKALPWVPRDAIFYPYQNHVLAVDEDGGAEFCRCGPETAELLAAILNLLHDL